MLIYSLALLLLPLSASSKQADHHTTLHSRNVATNNWHDAASLQAAAVTFHPASYTFTNVATGARMTYNAHGNHIYPANHRGSPIAISSHGGVPWIRLAFGGKNKCLSSAWGGTSNNAAVAYMCAVGKSARKSTLEQTKQWWLAVPVGARLGKASNSQNVQLIAAQAASIATRNKKLAGKFGHRFVKRAMEKRDRVVKSGTFYIIPSDHLIDQRTRALTGQVVNSRGIKTTALTPWSKGSKKQQWIVTPHH